MRTSSRMPSPHGEPSAPPISKRRARLLWLLVGFVTVISVAIGFVLLGPTGDQAEHSSSAGHPTTSGATPNDAAGERPTTSQSGIPETVPTPGGPQPTGPKNTVPKNSESEVTLPTLTPASARATLSNFLGHVEELAAAPALSDPTGFAHGPILSELQNDQQELVDNGWTRHGSAVIVSIAVASAPDLTQTPITAVVNACIDSSSIELLDSNSKRISPLRTSARQRSMNSYTVSHADNHWSVVSRSFPDKASC